ELAGQIAGLEANLNGQIAALEKDSTRLTTELSGTSSGSTYHQSLSVKLTEVTGQVSTADNQLASLSTYSDTGGTVISAALPLTPSGLGHSVVLVLGVLIGLLLGLVFAFMRDSFDDRVRGKGRPAVAQGAHDHYRGKPRQPRRRGGPGAAGDPGRSGSAPGPAYPPCGRRRRERLVRPHRRRAWRRSR